VSLVIGRFQPFTKGHLQLLKNAKHPVIVAIVKGKQTSKNKENNPFPFDLQKEVIMSSGVNNIIDVYSIESASLPYMISISRDNGYEPVEMFAGTDRYKMYKYQQEKYAPQINSKIKIKEIHRDQSSDDVTGIAATKVRDALRNDDFDQVSRMMIGLKPNIYAKLRSYL